MVLRQTRRRKMATVALDDAQKIAVLQTAVSDLLAWAEQTGGWEAPCWSQAKQALVASKRRASKSGATA